MPKGEYMKTMSQKFVLFSVAACVAALVGCGSDQDKNSSVVITNPNKKVTKNVRCKDTDKMNISATWNLLDSQYGFLINFGFAEQPPIETVDADASISRYEYAEGKRGRSYLLQVTSLGRNGQNDYRNISITIPKCADLAEYKKAHPEYREPLEYVLVF
jgi:hypothetical protein